MLDAAGVSGIELVGLDEVPPFPEAPETGATFEENALAKARDGAAATGMPCIADDSGVEIDALNGMPGVLSARWSGTHGNDGANTALVLAQLGDVPDERRGAAFVLRLCTGDPWRRRDRRARRMARGDRPRTSRRRRLSDTTPIFRPDGDTRSAAELTPGREGCGVTSRGARSYSSFPRWRHWPAEPNPKSRALNASAFRALLFGTLRADKPASPGRFACARTRTTGTGSCRQARWQPSYRASTWP